MVEDRGCSLEQHSMLGWLRQAGNWFQDYAAIHVTGMILAGDLGHVDLFKMCVSICTSLVIFIFLKIIKVRKGQCRTGVEHRDGQDIRPRHLSPPGCDCLRFV